MTEKTPKREPMGKAQVYLSHLNRLKSCERNESRLVATLKDALILCGGAHVPGDEILDIVRGIQGSHYAEKYGHMARAILGYAEGNPVPMKKHGLDTMHRRY